MNLDIPKPKARNIFFTKDVDLDSISELTKEILEIEDHDNHLRKVYEFNDLVYNPKPIKIYIDSYGGYVYQCFGLLSVIKSCKTPIHTIVTGCAMSCGFLIAIAGHKRFAYPKATHMYHQVSSALSGKAKDIEEDLAETKRLQKMLEQHTLECTSITKKQLKENFKAKKDWFMNSEEALKLKVIDEII